jgi:hypothetical protein
MDDLDSLRLEALELEQSTGLLRLDYSTQEREGKLLYRFRLPSSAAAQSGVLPMLESKGFLARRRRCETFRGLSCRRGCETKAFAGCVLNAMGFGAMSARLFAGDSKAISMCWSGATAEPPAAQLSIVTITFPHSFEPPRVASASAKRASG